MRFSKDRGFTLLEALTATAILVVVCMSVLKISMQVLGTWERASKGISSETEINLALDAMEDDLETAFPYFWIYDEKDDKRVSKNIRLCFLKEGLEGEWSALAYQVGYDGAKSRYGLYRCVMAVRNGIRDKAGFKELLNPEQLSLKQIMTSSNLLAKNVENFSIKFLYRDKTGNRQWTSEARSMELPICAEISMMTSEGHQLTRRVPFMVDCIF